MSIYYTLYIQQTFRIILSYLQRSCTLNCFSPLTIELLYERPSILRQEQNQEVVYAQEGPDGFTFFCLPFLIIKEKICILTRFDQQLSLFSNETFTLDHIVYHNILPGVILFHVNRTYDAATTCFSIKILVMRYIHFTT